MFPMDSGQLSELLRSELSPAAMVSAVALAFVLGAFHALSPGHGKTLVAAYLAGSRGRFQHALLLGGTVTFTHTISVFALGFATLFLTQGIVPQQIVQDLSVISGLAVIAVGFRLLTIRWHAWQHARGLARYHDHHHGEGDHNHHQIPETISLGSLLALGASGGLVPCPSALVLMLTAISLDRVALGLLLLGVFSIGLAFVLIAVGAAVLYAGRLVPRNLPSVRWLPVASELFIIAAGFAITGAAVIRH